MGRLLLKMCFDADGDAVPGAEYLDLGGTEFIPSIGTDDLYLNRVVYSGAQRGLTQSPFIEGDFSRRSAGHAGADAHAA